MKLPVSWLAEFIVFPKNFDPSKNIEKLVAGFVKVGFEVENVVNPAANIKGPLKVGTVLEIEELTGHKKPIRFVSLDLAENSVRQVICGATNFKVGDQVVVALPGAILPGNFAISARETYGRLSNGMICSARELGMGDDHTGIIVLDGKFKNGSDAFKDIDSKSLKNRLAKLKKSGKTIPVELKDKTGADLIFVRSLSGLDSTANTPAWMAKRLTQAGMRSISLAVDITNYVMLELGQPLHAFDAEKINGKLRVQRAGSFKSITTLDNQNRKLSKDDLLI
ncbi:MAG: phenylalanine--tRNA ligase beta subunit-related protein, partial [Candidatus Nanopelagicaceae bacterium]